MKVIAATTYISPKVRPLNARETNIRNIAHAIKNPPSPAISIAASAMAYALFHNYEFQGPVDLCPIPSSKGDIRANLDLCEAIVEELQLWDPNTQFTCKTRIGKRFPTQSQHSIVGKRTQKLPFFLIHLHEEAKDIFLVDNVIASGLTLLSAQEALHRPGHALVFGDSQETYQTLINQ